MMGGTHGMTVMGQYPPGTMSKNPADFLGVPPFEKPNILQVWSLCNWDTNLSKILKNFLGFKFSSLAEDKMKIAERITKLVILQIAKHEIPPPKAPSSPFEQVDKIYQLNYKR